MNFPVSSAERLSYLSERSLEHLRISASDIVSEIERQIVGQKRGEVWCAPKSVVLPGDDRYIMATLGVASEPRVLATKALVTNPRNAERGLPTLNSPDHAARQRDGASAGSGRWQLGDGEAHSGS